MAPEWWPESNRNAGRIPAGTVAAFLSESWPDSAGIRTLTIGRKNWLFVGSEDGGQAAATILSLIQTCRNLDINPQEYLEDVLRRIMSHPAKRIDELLPDRWLASRQKIAESQTVKQDGLG